MGGEKVMGEEELLRCVNFLRDEITAMRSAQDELRDELREMKAANDKSFTALLNELQKVAVEKVQGSLFETLISCQNLFYAKGREKDGKAISPC